MIDAGDRYAKIEGIDNPGTISYDELVDTLGVDEYQDVFGAIAEAVQKGTKPDVQTKPAKKTAKNHPHGKITSGWYLWYGFESGIDEERSLVNPFFVPA